GVRGAGGEGAGAAPRTRGGVAGTPRSEGVERHLAARAVSRLLDDGGPGRGAPPAVGRVPRLALGGAPGTPLSHRDGPAGRVGRVRRADLPGPGRPGRAPGKRRPSRLVWPTAPDRAGTHGRRTGAEGAAPRRPVGVPAPTPGDRPTSPNAPAR